MTAFQVRPWRIQQISVANCIVSSIYRCRTPGEDGKQHRPRLCQIRCPVQGTLGLQETPWRSDSQKTAEQTSRTRFLWDSLWVLIYISHFLNSLMPKLLFPSWLIIPFLPPILCANNTFFFFFSSEYQLFLLCPLPLILPWVFSFCLIDCRKSGLLNLRRLSL